MTWTDCPRGSPVVESLLVRSVGACLGSAARESGKSYRNSDPTARIGPFVSVIRRFVHMFAVQATGKTDDSLPGDDITAIREVAFAIRRGTVYQFVSSDASS